MPNIRYQYPITKRPLAQEPVVAPRPSLSSPFPGTAPSPTVPTAPVAAAVPSVPTLPSVPTPAPVPVPLPAPAQPPPASAGGVPPTVPVTPPATTPPVSSDNSINPQNPNDIVQGYLDQLLSSNGTYLGNAARRGLEVANTRGLMNSSIAAGASQRAAIEAVQPLLDNVLGVHNAQQDFQFRRALQSDSAAQQDWLRSNDFTDRFNANIAMLPINSAMGMLDALTQYALSDPETFTPDVMSGFTTFFNNNMLNLLNQYFPNNSTPAPIAGPNPPVRPASLDSAGGTS